MRNTLSIASLMSVLAAACMTTGTQDAGSGTGGTPTTGGTTGSGGATGSGGTTGSGGATGAGGRTSTGGTPGTGGSTGAGGATSAGGASGTGGTTNAGGATGAGGATKTGGTTGAGGSTSTGGATSAGGATGTGAGTNAGGATGTGGSTGAGGATGAGGSTVAGTTCATAYFSTTAAGKLSGDYTAWKTAYVKDCTNGGGTGSSGVVKDGSQMVSEGIGYGMLLAAHNNDEPLLKRLWQFYQDHLDKNGLMNWNNAVCEAPGNNNQNAATDGDVDAAMALVVADKNWGGYKTQALSLIGKIKQYETDTCSNGLTVLRPGDMFGGCSDAGNKGRVNPSYFAPGYYHVWAQLDSANSAFWTKLADDTYTLLAQLQAISALNGLVPDWADATTGTQWYGAGYSYDACRTPWRIAADYMWFCTPAAKTFLSKISAYVDGQGGPANVPFDKNSAFVGAFADSGVAISQAKIDSYVTAWTGATMADNAYFQSTLRGLYMLVAAGKFMSGL